MGHENIRERDVEAYLKKQVETHGGQYRRVAWIGRRGAPDDFVMLNGGHWTECKAPGGLPEAHQEREHRRMRKHGIPVFVLDSLEKVDLFINYITGVNHEDRETNKRSVELHRQALEC